MTPEEKKVAQRWAIAFWVSGWLLMLIVIWDMVHWHLAAAILAITLICFGHRAAAIASED